MYYYIGFYYTLCSTKMQHFLAKLSRPAAKDEQRVGEATVASSGKVWKCRNNGRRDENEMTPKCVSECNVLSRYHHTKNA